jgi:hypothetical protein
MQGLYLVAVGLWPMVHMPSFIALAGPREDLWAVRMAALLTIMIGMTLYRVRNKAWRDDLTVVLLAMGSAASYLAIDVAYVAQGAVSPVHLVDAVMQLIVLTMWNWARPLALVARSISRR